jgi:hypothetical protein
MNYPIFGDSPRPVDWATSRPALLHCGRVVYVRAGAAACSGNLHPTGDPASMALCLSSCFASAKSKSWLLVILLSFPPTPRPFRSAISCARVGILIRARIFFVLRQ